MSKYSDLLKDVRWQKKRLTILKRDNWRCTGCGWNEGSMHVHHKIYLPGKRPWEYPNKTLATLCEACHQWEVDKNG